jgi:trehalose 6-phosphate synthase/phosphatase
MLGVDRLDMVKGIPQKLLAYEKFLEEHPEWRDKVIAFSEKTQIMYEG